MVNRNQRKTFDGENAIRRLLRHAYKLEIETIDDEEIATRYHKQAVADLDTLAEEIDVIAAAMTITEGRQETIAFSDPYWESDQAILVREGGDFQPSEWADFEGARVGAQSGTTGADVVESNLVAEGVTSEDNFSTYDSYVLAVEDLANENIDAVVVDNPVAETFAANRDVTVAFIEETGERFGFGLRQGESELQSALNDGLQTVRDDGTYQEITNTWFGQE